MHPATDPLAVRYEDAWSGFVQELNACYAEVGRLAGEEGTDLQRLIARFRPIPYDHAHGLLSEEGADRSSHNIGSMTGLFFERLVSAVVIGYLRRWVPGAHIERNTCSGHLRDINRDPDIHVVTETGAAVFEIKAAPKLRDMNAARRHRASYAAKETPFYLIGGYVSLNPADLIALGADRWAAFCDGSSKTKALIATMPRIDDLLLDARRHLTAQ